MTTVAAAVGGRQSSTTTAQTTASARIDPNSFLKLLVAELRYQDPTKPMDTTQLVQQLASMSQVEQAAQTNSKLAAILDQLSLTQSSHLIGMTVTSLDGSRSGEIVSIRSNGDGSVASLTDGSEIVIGQGIKISR